MPDGTYGPVSSFNRGRDKSSAPPDFSRLLEDKSYDEIAEAMKTSMGAVRCHLARARSWLRETANNRAEHSPFTRRKKARAFGGDSIRYSPRLAILFWLSLSTTVWAFLILLLPAMSLVR
jgi:hypothetical protein